MRLYSKLISDLDARVASAAISQLAKRLKWQPTPAELRAEYDGILDRVRRQDGYRKDRAEQRLLPGPDDLRPIHDVVRKLSEKVAMDPPRGIFKAPGEAKAPAPEQTTAERLERRDVLRAQAAALRER